MTIKFTTTGNSTDGIKILVYGKSGVGKTRLIVTAPAPIIISSENKLISLQKENIPVIQVQTLDDLEQALNQILAKKKFKKFRTICIDSISDICETALAIEKPLHKDPRKAYMAIQDKTLSILKQIRDSEGINFYIIAKEKMVLNSEGEDIYSPSMPGRVMAQELPYIFDFIFPMKVYIDQDDKDKSFTYLQTTVLQDDSYIAKSGIENLRLMERPDLKMIFKKIKKA